MWELYGADSKVDLVKYLEEILRETDGQLYLRIKKIIDRVEELEEQVKELENTKSELESSIDDMNEAREEAESKYVSLYDRITEALKE